MKKATRRRFQNGMALMVFPAAVLVLASCSSPPVVWNSKTSFTPSAYATPPDFGGEVVTDSISTTATVVSIDHTKRLVVLKCADGGNVTYKALPNAFAFDDIKAGDQVKVSVAKELAVFLGKNSVPTGAVPDTTKLRVKLPDGTLADATEVRYLAFNAKITAIDDWLDTVTLQLPDGTSKTIKVSEAVNLADVSVGDVVSVKSTEAAVVALQKP